MKLLCSILAVMILVLSCIPCTDTEGFTIQRGDVAAVQKADVNPDQSSEHQDLCSPFCQCACCAIAFALPIPAIPQVSFRVSVPEQLFASYLQQKPVGIAVPVWQPPRLV
ncbi:MAG TPA: DUF6660 family protein [Flavipsychrobacter sp.]|nr:DUF6660 family protein [Flavipsychrobacter sp.]